MRRIFNIFILVMFFLIGFSYSAKVFSAEEIQIKVVQNQKGQDIVKIYTPSNIEMVYLEIYNIKKKMLAGLHLDHYSLEYIGESRKNTFIFLSDITKDKNEIMFKLFPGTDREEVFIKKDLEIIYDDSRRVTNEQQSGKIRVMSFNIHHGRNKIGLYNLDKIVNIIKKNDVDIVGLQEVDRNIYRSKFQDQIEVLAQSLGMYYAFGPNIKIMGAEYGNAILSRYPIKNYENVQFPGLKENRGLLMSKIQIEDKKINFLVTHLGLAKQEKNNQIKIIKKYVDFLGEKIILVGDFNSSENSDNINYLKEKLIDAATKEEGRYLATYNGILLKSRIDYIFTSQDIQVLNFEVIDTDASDHLPIVAHLEI